jgi:hypothetical protein
MRSVAAKRYLVDKILFSSVNTCGGARRVKRPRVLLNLLGERSLHAGEVVGSIPTAPTSKNNILILRMFLLLDFL